MLLLPRWPSSFAGRQSFWGLGCSFPGQGSRPIPPEPRSSLLLLTDSPNVDMSLDISTREVEEHHWQGAAYMSTRPLGELEVVRWWLMGSGVTMLAHSTTSTPDELAAPQSCPAGSPSSADAGRAANENRPRWSIGGSCHIWPSRLRMGADLGGPAFGGPCTEVDML